MAKRTAKQVWQQLVDEAGEQAIEEVLAMSPEQVDRELERHGFDLAAEDAKADKFLHDLGHGFIDASGGAPDPVAPSPEPRPASGVVSTRQPARRTAPDRRRRPPAAVVLLAAVTAGAVAGGAIYAARHHGQAPSPPGPQPPGPAPSPSSTAPGPEQTLPPDLVAAADWRKKAFTACDAERWTECLADLDQARALDPAGDSAPLAKSARERALRALQPKPDKPPIPRTPRNQNERPPK